VAHARAAPYGSLVRLARWTTALSFSIVSALSSSASAQRALPADRWSDVAPGLRVLERTVRWTDGGLARVFAARVDLCQSTLTVRVSSPNEGARTVSAFARNARALIAVNGDYFDRATLRPTGPARASGLLWSTSAWTHHDSIFAIHRDGSATFRDVTRVSPS
jgi:hypothetical protein